MTKSLTLALGALMLAGCAPTARPVASTPPAPVPPAIRPAAGPADAAPGLVSAADPRATEAGREILRAGGSASDAAIAMMLALTVVEPQSSGIGGGGFFVYHDGATGRIATVDGREEAPASASPRLFLDAQGKPLPFDQAYPGGKSVGVPGNIRLAQMVHRKWGKLPWARLFDPAIRLADEGFTVNAALHNAIVAQAPIWDRFPAIRALYAPAGVPRAVGDRLRNPELAAFLRTLAAAGPDSFYRGPAASGLTRTVADAQVNGAGLGAADLAAYKAIPRDALCTTYRRYKVCGMGPPSAGATTVFQILGMLERFDMAALGASNPESWHLIGEAMQLAYADRATYVGDPAFVSVPVTGLIDKSYLASRSALISRTGALPAYAPGTPPGAPPRLRSEPGDVSGTTHFVARDRSGSIASMTSTIEGIFGSQLLVDGYVLNNELTDFSFAPTADGYRVANRVEPRKRPLSSMAPTIVYDADGRPLLALGSAGGKRIIMHVAKTLIGVLDFGLPVDQAIALPNLFFQGNDLLIENTPLGATLAPQMLRYGQTVRAVALGSKVNALQRVGTGWVGAPDPRSPGTALGE